MFLTCNNDDIILYSKKTVTLPLEEAMTTHQLTDNCCQESTIDLLEIQ